MGDYIIKKENGKEVVYKEGFVIDIKVGELGHGLFDGDYKGTVSGNVKVKDSFLGEPREATINNQEGTFKQSFSSDGGYKFIPDKKEANTNEKEKINTSKSSYKSERDFSYTSESSYNSNSNDTKNYNNESGIYKELFKSLLIGIGALLISIPIVSGIENVIKTNKKYNKSIENKKRIVQKNNRISNPRKSLDSRVESYDECGCPNVPEAERNRGIWYRTNNGEQYFLYREPQYPPPREPNLIYKE